MSICEIVRTSERLVFSRYLNQVSSFCTEFQCFCDVTMFYDEMCYIVVLNEIVIL